MGETSGGENKMTYEEYVQFYEETLTQIKVTKTSLRSIVWSKDVLEKINEAVIRTNKIVIQIYQFLKPFLWKKLSRKLRIFFIFCFIFLIFAKLATLITPIILGKTIDSLSLLDSMQNSNSLSYLMRKK